MGWALEAVNQRREGTGEATCPPLLNEPQCDHNLLGQSCFPRLQPVGPRQPLEFPTSTSKVWGPPSQPRLPAALALLLSFKPAHRSSLSDFGTSAFSYVWLYVT